MLFCKERNAISTLTTVLIVLIVVALVVGVVVGVFLSGWFWFRPSGQIVGSGNLDTKKMDLGDFTIIEVGWAFKVEITQSSSYSVSITADDNLFDYIEASKTGDILTIGLKSDYSYQWPLTLRAEITMPDLYELKLSGATYGTVKGFYSSHKLVLGISGASTLDAPDISAGEIEINLDGASKISGGITANGDAQFTVSGASKVELEGVANDLLVSADGASSVELPDFPVHNANVNLSGASRATVNLDGRLDANLSGASQLLYIGEPTMMDINTSGGSTVSQK